MSAEADPQAEPQQRSIQLVSEETFYLFNVSAAPIEGGGALLTFILPTGVAMGFPIGEEAWERLKREAAGSALVTPELHVPPGVDLTKL